MVKVGVITDSLVQEVNGQQPFPVRLLAKKGVRVTCAITRPPSATDNQKQTVTFAAECQGHVQLAMGYELSPALRQNQDAATWKASLEKMHQVGSGQLNVVKTNTLTFELEFTGTFANKYVAPLQVKAETYKTSYLSGYWPTAEIIFAKWPVGSTWLAASQLTPGYKTYGLLPRSTGPSSGTYEIRISNLPSSNVTSSTVTIPYNATASQVQSLLNANSLIGPGGVTVIGEPLTTGQMQIDMVNAKYLVRLFTVDPLIDVIPIGRSVQVADDGSGGWQLTGVSWNY